MATIINKAELANRVAAADIFNQTAGKRADLVAKLGTLEVFNQSTLTKAEISERLAELDVFGTKASVAPVIALLSELNVIGNRPSGRSDIAEVADVVASLSTDVAGKGDAVEAVETVISTIVNEVAEGNTVQIAGLGKFYPHTQPAKSGEINGVAYSAAERQVPKFKAGVQFKVTVAGE